MKPDWIAVDWGTSNLRAWAMGPDGPSQMVESTDGMGRLDHDGFEPALLRLIGPWLNDATVHVVACGMVGARQGWIEAAYRPVPCHPVSRAGHCRAPVADPRLAVDIVAGLRQDTPADVMRGEETQIAGVLARYPAFDGVICLPGTHSKWARISAGEVVAFQTFMTGEMFALLSTQSVLRHGMLTIDQDDAAFDVGLSDGLSRPDHIAARLFSLRAEGLLAGLSPEAAKSRLSGLLIGIELAASKPWWLGQRVVLVGNAGLSAAYARALAAQGLIAETMDATACTLAGLAAARPLLSEV